MEKKFLICLAASLSLSPLCQAKCLHSRNQDLILDGDFSLEERKSAPNIKKMQITVQSKIFDIEGKRKPLNKAACKNLPKHLAKIQKAHPDNTPENHRLRNRIALNLVRHDGEFDFPESRFTQPEKEYDLTDKINTLEFLLKEKAENIDLDVIARAAFMLPSLYERAGQDVHKLEIFRLYRIASTLAPHTGFGALAAQIQLEMMGETNIQGIASQVISSGFSKEKLHKIIDENKKRTASPKGKSKSYARESSREWKVKKVGKKTVEVKITRKEEDSKENEHPLSRHNAYRNLALLRAN